VSRSVAGGWQAIQGEVLRRIHAREWPPGHVIPGEVELAREFGCARATVNRALQELAEAGLLERRRKAGTRVALHPVSRATLDIPVIRREIEDLGRAHGYRLLHRAEGAAPSPLAGPALHLRALHSADGLPYVVEDRCISLTVVPQARGQDFAKISANEWLIASVPYTHGDIAFTAVAATHTEAAALGCPAGAALFAVDRTTWDNEQAITAVRLSYAPGYRIRSRIGAAGGRPGRPG